MEIDHIEAWDASYSSSKDLHRTEDGIEIYYEKRGEGPLILILSSAFVISTAWRNFSERLVEKNTLLTYDIRNQGASSDADATYADHLRDVKSLVDDLEVEQAYVLGVSFATLMARDFAYENPDRVKGLIMCGPALSAYESNRRKYQLKNWLEVLEAEGPKGLFDATYPLIVGDRTIARGGSAAYLALRERFLTLQSKAQLRINLTGALEADDNPEKLRSLKCPTLLFTGDDDFNIGRAGLEDLAALIPDGQVEVMERCGHAPYFEQTEEFERIVQRFVTEIENRVPSPVAA
ncbi:MAG TPA: alpha/beta hydrolase [Solirubrobacterales bacterium]|nr:alpha/beta hydrolase [Solirubrobacterales bacterium]